MSEFNLSDKIQEEEEMEAEEFGLKIEDVKEFIRLLKEEILLDYNWVCPIIDKLAGEKLC